MGRIIAPLLCGLLFGAGLAVSGLANPAKVLAFLDITGQWDPSLVLVMGAGVVVFAVGFRLTTRAARPLLAEKFEIPTRRDIDSRLVIGALMFGMGWGLAGFCPGPALTGLAFGLTKVYVFVAAMVAGSLAFGLWTRFRT
ncbi:DUF6691 family protein [Emcibacter sp. SYSU 3D8]|uniref:DUF6691 family protein n=1 Tax=Emcibacter sp. SYSU 3D8 TaxID=3133969 RepID=UPI0031FEC7B4